MSMMNKKVVLAMGGLMLSSIAVVANANATDFQATELATGYQLSAVEASCGADKVKTDTKSKEAKL
jgi:long-subunit fatty acid transport protein